MLIKTLSLNKLEKLTWKINDNAKLIVDVDLVVFSFILVVDKHNYYDVNNFVEKEMLHEMQEEIMFMLNTKEARLLPVLMRGFAETVYDIFLKDHYKPRSYENVNCDIMRKG